MLKTSNEAIENDKNYLVDSLADISHQLKTPLTSLMVITDLLKTEEDSENRKKFVCIIENQCEKMKWLIATLLKLSKLDTETVDFIKIQLSISDVLDESLKSFMLTLDLKNIKLETNINDFTFIGDKNWCVEAVQNIIKNCIEHTDENGVLKISTNSTTLYNQLLIEDNGCGIAPEDLPHIFERFYHGKNASSDSVGIGLALSKAILSKHNASVEVNSSQGCGTTFDIRFYKSIV
jgi:signal transduction histidine kinase